MEFIKTVLSSVGLVLDDSAPDIVIFSLFYLILLCFILIRFFKRIFVPIFNIVKDFLSFLINMRNFSLFQIYNSNTKLFNGMIYIISAIIIYSLINNITVIDCIQILIFTIISFAIYMFISDKFK